jgi:hypothetical protein
VGLGRDPIKRAVVEADGLGDLPDQNAFVADGVRP